MFKKAGLCVLLLLAALAGKSQQFLTDLIDTTKPAGRGVYGIYQRYDHLFFTGYIQPQWQWASEKGAKGFSGGDFAPYADNRFTLRRGRIRVDYVVRHADGQPATQFVFQFDATERGVFARDVWGRYFENKLKLFALTAGLFGRPFGYEVNLASIDRESPERGRASQLLMRTERDLGVMLSLEPRGARLRKINWLRFDVGLFNGPGLSSTTDYDSYKDLIARLYARPLRPLPNGWRLSGGLSLLRGGLFNPSPELWRMDGSGQDARYVAASGVAKARRQYAGADVQLRIPNRRGFTELRAEYLQGLQTGTAASSETPGSLPTAAGANTLDPFLYERPFNAAYFYVLQHLGSPQHQLGLKYDWYDPNTRVQGAELRSGQGFSTADVRFDTFGGGYIWYATPHLKATLWYDHVRNEKTALAGYTDNVPDDVFTARLQYRF